jgi:hypothetical protein
MLSSTDEPGHCEFLTDNVYFFMTIDGHRIRCGITDQALEVFEPKIDRTRNGRLSVFNMHRVIIERAASAKFDSQKWERDGTTILIRTADIETTQAANRFQVPLHTLEPAPYVTGLGGVNSK